jgi:hypothetical protein
MVCRKWHARYRWRILLWRNASKKENNIVGKSSLILI